MNRGLLSPIEAECRRYKALGEGTVHRLSAQELVRDSGQERPPLASPGECRREIGFR